MAVRCKMRLFRRNQTQGTRWDAETQQNVPQEMHGFEFHVVTKGDAEDTAFWMSTPVGRLEFSSVNPEVGKQLELNKTYYVTITPAE